MLYNAYNAALAQAQAGQNPLLIVGGQQLANYAHSAPGRALLALPGVDVPFVLGAITPNQVRSQRPSYINAILIQSRGALVPGGCSRCRLPRPGLRPFPECRRVPGHFGGCCGNCKWRDHAARCVVTRPRSESDDSDDSDSTGDDSDGPDEGGPGPRKRRQIEAPPPKTAPAPASAEGQEPGATASNAIVLA